MNKIKIILLCVFSFILILLVFNYIKIRQNEEYQQKIVLAKETRKALEHLMVDLSQARENSILDVLPDGNWYSRVAFKQDRLGAIEYIIKEGHLMRFNQGKEQLIADDINALHIRRQMATPDILEVQIEAKNNVSLISNFRIRVLRH